MNDRLRRSIKLLTVCLVVLFVFGVSARMRVLADTPVNSGTCGDSLSWSVNPSGVLTISGTGEMYNYSYSSAPWRNTSWDVKTVEIGSGVTSVGSYAFYNMKVSSVSFPNTLTRIGECAFADSRYLHSVTIPGSVTEIGEGAFIQSNLDTVVIENGVTDLGRQMFRRCPYLTSVTLPSSLRTIGYACFYDCYNLNGLVLPEGLTRIEESALWGVYLPELTIPSSVSYIGKNALDGGGKKNVYLTSLEHLCSIEFGGDSFLLDNADVHIGGTLTTSVTVPASVTEIGPYTFSRWNALESVSFAGSISSIGEGAFFVCNGLETVTLPNTVTEIGAYAFYFCPKLSTISLPYTVRTIGDEAFCLCSSLESVTIPQNVESLGMGAFWQSTGLRYVEFWSSPLTSISENLFYGCTNLTEVSMPSDMNVTEIGASAFRETNLSTIVIPGGVTKIESYAFDSCASLRSVSLPASLTNVYASAFKNCTSLKEVFYKGTTEQQGHIYIDLYNEPLKNSQWYADIVAQGTCGSDMKWIIANGRTLYISGSRAMYDYAAQGTSGTTAPWDSYKNSIDDVVVLAGVESIGEYAFYRMPLTGLSIQNADVTIKTAAFQYSSLSSIDLGTGTVVIGSYAFSNEQNMTEVTLGGNVRMDAGGHAFALCSNLKTVTIGCPSIAQYSFDQCTKLDDVTLLNSVRMIGESAFVTTAISSISIPAGVQSIAAGALYSLNGVAVTVNGPETVLMENSVVTGSITAPECSNAHLYAIEYSKPFYVLEGSASAHTYAEPVWAWSDDLSAATVHICCTRGDDDHTLTAEVSVQTEPAHCESDGLHTYTASAELNGAVYTDVQSVTIPAPGHQYGGEPIWMWSEDLNTVAAAFTCTVCDAAFLAVDGEVLDREVVPATHTADGYINATAIVSYLGSVYLDTKEVILPSPGHSYGAPAWTWTDSYAASATFTCPDDGASVTLDASVSYADIPATHTATGLRTYTAAVEFEGTQFTDTATQILPAVPHEYGAPVWTWADDHSSASAKFTCECGDTQTVEAGITTASSEPTHTADGWIRYTAAVEFEGGHYTDEVSVVLDATGHTYAEPFWRWVPDGSSAQLIVECTGGDDTITIDAAVVQTGRVIEPTCTEEGQTRFIGAAMYNGTNYTDTYIVTQPALGHAWGEPSWTWDETGAAYAVFTCANDAAHVESVEATVTSEVTVAPGRYTEGLRTHTAAVTFGDTTYTMPESEARTEIIPATHRIRKNKTAGDKTVSLDVKTDTLDVAIESEDIGNDPVLVASYDENGRFMGLVIVTESTDTINPGDNADAITIFWVDGNAAPLAECEKIIRMTE